MSAYVVIALLETGLPIKPSVLEQAENCLVLASYKGQDTYSMAVTAYAFSLLYLRRESKHVLDTLIANAKTEDDMVYWTLNGNSSNKLEISNSMIFQFQIVLHWNLVLKSHPTSFCPY